MRRAYPVELVRRAELRLMATLPDGALMQRAAAGLAAACALFLGGAYGRRILVLAGSGDNGGDALFAGARLARRGAAVDALLLSPDKVHAEALAALRAAGGRTVTEPSPGTDLVLDGIVGIGGSGGLRAHAAQVWEGVHGLGCPVVAVDVPSGIGVDDGTVSDHAVDADLTVTFGAYKIGLLVGSGARQAGPVELVDIGLDEHLGEPAVVALTAGSVRELLVAAAPGAADHKYTRGVVGVAAGSAEFTGAGVLAVAGAASGLAGMVRYSGPDPVSRLVRERHPEVVVGDGRVQAWVVGSGGGGDADAVLARALKDDVPMVVDADALEHLDRPVGAPALLTPHAGELARLLDRDRAEVERDPLGSVRDAADTYGAVVMLKGDRTLVAAPGGSGEPVYVNTIGPDWLATAGSGDVLAGLCGSVLATGLDPLRAGALSAWLHGAAGTYASGGRPVTASDVAAALPTVIGHVLQEADG